MTETENTGDKEKKLRVNRHASGVWDYFTFDARRGKVKCKCGKEYSHQSGGSTNSMNRHLPNCTAKLLDDSKAQINIGISANGEINHSKGQTIIGFGTNNLTARGQYHFDPNTSLQFLIDMIIEDEEPFKIVEHPGFLRFIYVSFIH